MHITRENWTLWSVSAVWPVFFLLVKKMALISADFLYSFETHTHMLSTAIMMWISMLACWVSTALVLFQRGEDSFSLSFESMTDSLLYPKCKQTLPVTPTTNACKHGSNDLLINTFIPVLSSANRSWPLVAKFILVRLKTLAIEAYTIGKVRRVNRSQELQPIRFD